MDLYRSFTPTHDALITGRQIGLPSPARVRQKGEAVLNFTDLPAYIIRL
jgi:hypothetical protein